MSDRYDDDYDDYSEYYGMSTFEDTQFIYSPQDLYDDVKAFMDEVDSQADKDAAFALLNDIGKLLELDPSQWSSDELNALDDRYFALVGCVGEE